jgi:hypothetical protein
MRLILIFVSKYMLLFIHKNEFHEKHSRRSAASQNYFDSIKYGLIKLLLPFYQLYLI